MDCVHPIRPLLRRPGVEARALESIRCRSCTVAAWDGTNSAISFYGLLALDVSAREESWMNVCELPGRLGGRVLRRHCGGVANYKIRIHHILSPIWGGLAPFDVFHQSFKCDPCEFLLRHLYSCQWRDYELSEPNIIEAHY